EHLTTATGRRAEHHVAPGKDVAYRRDLPGFAAENVEHADAIVTGGHIGKRGDAEIVGKALDTLLVHERSTPPAAGPDGRQCACVRRPASTVDALGVVHDFRDRAVEAEETVRQVERVAGLGKRAHAAHQVRAAASDHDVERRWAMTTEMLPQRIAHGAEGLIDIGVVRFAPDDEKDIGPLEPML